MLDMDTINKEIKKLEECDCTTWSVCSKLATLYTVRDHMAATPMKSMATSMYQGANENNTSMPQNQSMGKI